MLRRSLSHGRPVRSASASASLKSADRGRDAREQVPAHPEPVEHLGSIEVGETFALDERARLGEQGEAALHVAVLGTRHRLAVQRTHLQLRRAGSEHRGQCPRVLLDRGVELVLLQQRVGAGEDRLRLRAVVGGDAARQEARVDPQAQREPLDRLRGRARLAALDLGDVLLREALAGEPGLGESRGDAQLAQALSEARPGGRAGGAHSCGARSHAGSACRTLDPNAIP